MHRWFPMVRVSSAGVECSHGITVLHNEVISGRLKPRVGVLFYTGLGRQASQAELLSRSQDA